MDQTRLTGGARRARNASEVAQYLHDGQQRVVAGSTFGLVHRYDADADASSGN